MHGLQSLRHVPLSRKINAVSPITSVVPSPRIFHIPSFSWTLQWDIGLYSYSSGTAWLSPLSPSQEFFFFFLFTFSPPPFKMKPFSCDLPGLPCFSLALTIFNTHIDVYHYSPLVECQAFHKQSSVTLALLLLVTSMGFAAQCLPWCWDVQRTLPTGWVSDGMIQLVNHCTYREGSGRAPGLCPRLSGFYCHWFLTDIVSDKACMVTNSMED